MKVLDTKPLMSGAADVKPSMDSIDGFKPTVLPYNPNLNTQDDIVSTDLAMGMPMGLLLALTYNTTVIINP